MVSAGIRRVGGAWKRHDRALFEVLFFLALALAVVACLSLVFRRPGWPRNHEYLSFKFRIELYASHFRQGDLFPVWSSSDAHGMGTPAPVFYHKAFYFVGAGLYLLFGSMRLAVLASIAAFLVIGGYGIRFAVKQCTSDRALWFAGPLAFVFANYTFTNWFVRGAMAELSAAMLVPWVIVWCLVLVRERRFSLWIAPLLLVLYVAHSAIALFSLVLIAAAYAIFLLHDHRGLRATYRRAVASVGLLVVLAAPLLLATRPFLGDYNPGKITQAGYEPADNFWSPVHYFVDTHYTWLQTWVTHTVQIDYGLWVPISGFVVAVLVWLARRPAGERMTAMRAAVRDGAAPFLGLALLVFFLLQLRASNVLYTHVPFLKLVQFPWRLLALITPLAVVLVCVAFAALFRRLDRRTALVVLAVWLAAFALLSPLPHHFQYEAFPAKEVAAKTPASLDGMGAALLGVGEYLPVVKRGGRVVGAEATLALYDELYQQQHQSEALRGGPCIADRSVPKRLDELDETIVVRCVAAAQVALPVSYARDIRVTDTTTRHRLHVHHLASDPRLVVDLPAGTTRLHVALPTLGRMLWGLFTD